MSNLEIRLISLESVWKNIDKRLTALEHEVDASAKPTPQPVATGLCEVVEKFLDTFSVSHPQLRAIWLQYCQGLADVSLSLTAERKRAVLVKELIIASRAIAQFNTEDHGIRFPRVRCALDALDAFDKGVRNG